MMRILLAGMALASHADRDPVDGERFPSSEDGYSAVSLCWYLAMELIHLAVSLARKL